MTNRNLKKKQSLRKRQRQQQIRKRVLIAVLCAAVLAALIFIGSRDRETMADGNVDTEVQQDSTFAEETQTEEVTETPDGTQKVEPEPVSKDGLVVVIDAGHGGKDQGCAYGEMLEKDINLKLALLLRDELESAGVNVEMTRDDDTFVYLNRRVEAAENAGADAYISIHVDSYPGDSSIEGITVHYQKGASGGKTLATNLHDELQDSAITTIRKTMESDLYVLRNTSMPAALVEVGFLTNKSDRRNLQSETFLEELAKQLCGGITQYLEENIQP